MIDLDSCYYGPSWILMMRDVRKIKRNCISVRRGYLLFEGKPILVEREREI